LARPAGRPSFRGREILGFELNREGIEEAARALGADYVIAGSLYRKNGHIEVDAYLFRARPTPALSVDRLEWKATERPSIARDLADRLREAVLSAQ
jgi:TolB-like protein